MGPTQSTIDIMGLSPINKIKIKKELKKIKNCKNELFPTQNTK